MASTTTAARLVADEVLGQLGRKRLTRLWLSEATGIPMSTLNRRLNAQSPFTIDELVAVAVALEVSLSVLVAPLTHEVAA